MPVTEYLCGEGWARGTRCSGPLASQCSDAAGCRGCVARERPRGRVGTLDGELEPSRGQGGGSEAGPWRQGRGSLAGHPLCTGTLTSHTFHLGTCPAPASTILWRASLCREKTPGCHRTQDPRRLGGKKWPRPHAAEAPIGKLDLEKTFAG